MEVISEATLMGTIQRVALNLVVQLQELEAKLLAKIRLLARHALAQLLREALQQQLVIMDVQICVGATVSL